MQEIAEQVIECGVSKIFVAQLMIGESRGTFALQQFGDRLMLLSTEVNTDLLPGQGIACPARLMGYPRIGRLHVEILRELESAP